MARVGMGLGDFRQYLKVENQKAARQSRMVNKCIVWVTRVRMMVVVDAFDDPRLDLG